MRIEARKRIKLNEGDSIKSKGSRSKGFMAETDIYSYDIINANDEIIGTATHTSHTNVKGGKVTNIIIQQDMSGNTITEERW